MDNEKKTARLIKRPLGRLLLDAGLIEETHLEEALKLQRNTNKMLGETLVEMGVIEQTELDVAVSIQEQLSTLDGAIKTASGIRKLLGEMLVEARKLSPKDLEDALQEQVRTGAKIGNILVSRGLLTEAELHVALRFQSNLGEPLSCPLRLGEVLIAAGVITRAQLESAIELQKQTGKKLGEVLVEHGFAGHEHVPFFLNLQKKLVTAALIAALSFAPIAVSEAAGDKTSSSSATMTVRAYVKPYVQFDVRNMQKSITVRDSDIERGYIEVNSQTVLNVKSNGRYMVVFELAEPFSEVEIAGLRSGALIVQGAISLVEVQKTAPGTDSMQISFRFKLAKQIPAGTYSWPLVISATPMI